jgi:hypothetical protein
MSSVAEDVSNILATLRALEDRMKTLKAMLSPTSKERKPNPWILFTKRIDALLKENNVPFVNLGESKQFASSLKKQKAYPEWLDTEILAQRNDWLVDALLACPVCDENPREDAMKHRDCIVEFAKRENIEKNPIGAWMSAASIPQRNITEVTIIEDVRPKRGRGRPRKEVVETETSLPGTV